MKKYICIKEEMPYVLKRPRYFIIVDAKDNQNGAWPIWGTVVACSEYVDTSLVNGLRGFEHKEIILETDDFEEMMIFCMAEFLL